MLRSTHINMTLAVSMATFLSLEHFSIHMMFAAFYGIIQDWDHHNGFLANVFGISFPAKHRGFTHTLMFILLFVALVSFVGYLISLGLLGGSITGFGLDSFLAYVDARTLDIVVLFILLHGHLLGDVLTQVGIPYFYPLIKSNVKLPFPFLRVTTGESKGYNISGEMYINFIFSILNILLITHIASNYDKYGELFNSGFQEIIKSGDTKFFVLLFVLQFVFILYLFWKDIKSYIDHWSNFIKRLLKVITLLGIVSIINAVIYGVFHFFDISLSTIFFNLTQIDIPNLNNYFFVFLIGVTLLYGMYLTKKYIVSIASTISYVINVTYILLIYGIAAYYLI